MAEMVRQGDVLLVPVEVLPAALAPVAREQGRLVLAEGEATGHAHVIEAETAELQQLVDASGAAELYLLVHGGEPVALQHEEHAPIAVAAGSYRVVRQREFQPAPGREDWDWVRD